MRSHWPISTLSSVVAVVNMLIPLVLVRILTPEDVGLFRIFFMYLMLAPNFAFVSGLNSGLPYWSGRGERGRQAIQLSSLVTLLSAIGFFVLAFAFHASLAKAFDWPQIFGIVFAISLIGGIAGQFYEEAVISVGGIWRGAIFSSGFELVRTVGLLAVAFFTRDILKVFFFHAGMQSLKVILGYRLGIRDGLVSFRWDSVLFKDVWKYAFPVSLAWLFNILANFADQVLTSRYVSPAEFAYYSIGCLAIPPLGILAHSIARVTIPQMSSAFADGDSKKAGVLFSGAVGELAYFIVPAVAGLMVFSKPIIELLFTTRYSSSAAYLVVFAIHYLFFAIPSDAVPRARGEGRWILRTYVSFSIFTVLTCWVAIHFYGPWGALIGMVLTRGILAAYTLWYAKSSTGWTWRQTVPFGYVFRSVLVSLILSGLCLVSHRWFLESDLLWFGVTGGGFTLVYFAVTGYWTYRAEGRVPELLRRVLLATRLSR